VNETTFACGYDPKKVGEYIITITFGGQQISKSPFIVDVGPAKTTKITAYGPGLEGGVVGQPATFIVETHGETGALGQSLLHFYPAPAPAEGGEAGGPAPSPVGNSAPPTRIHKVVIYC